jgi:hypothetical protein
MNWRGGRGTRTRRTTSFSTRRRHTSCNNWRRIAILETASRKEHQYPSLCRSSKSSEKAKLLTTKTQLPTVCLDVFHRIFLSGGGTKQLIQPDRRSHRMPDISLLDMTTFIVLTLQMGHDLTDTPSVYWSGLRKIHTPFYGETMTREVLPVLRFCTSETIHTDPNNTRNMTLETKDCLSHIEPSLC